MTEPFPEAIAPISTDRLLLRKMAATDVDWVWELDQDPEVMRHITGGVPTPREVTEKVHMPRLLQSHSAGSAFGFWAALDRDTGVPLGWFHMRPERLPPFEMELGYRLRRDAWGRGLATEGSRKLIDLTLHHWGQLRVAARTLAGNLASRRVMEKCGLVWERDFHYPEEWLPGWPEDRRQAVRYLIERR
ncbi:MAG: GNAT family N-acetyltransferase [Verrucomicrobiales bacterium]|nr:GNAT family N-acetyltransferase [Verrucomicrobiales bacterium]